MRKRILGRGLARLEATSSGAIRSIRSALAGRGAAAINGGDRLVEQMLKKLGIDEKAAYRKFRAAVGEGYREALITCSHAAHYGALMRAADRLARLPAWRGAVTVVVPDRTIETACQPFAPHLKFITLQRFWLDTAFDQASHEAAHLAVGDLRSAYEERRINRGRAADTLDLFDAMVMDLHQEIIMGQRLAGALLAARSEGAKLIIWAPHDGDIRWHKFCRAVLARGGAHPPLMLSQTLHKERQDFAEQAPIADSDQLIASARANLDAFMPVGDEPPAPAWPTLDADAGTDSAVALVSDARPGTAYWRAAVNLAEAAKARGQPLRAIVSDATAAEQLRPICRSVEIAHPEQGPIGDVVASYAELLNSLERMTLTRSPSDNEHHELAHLLLLVRLTEPAVVGTIAPTAVRTQRYIESWLVARRAESVIVVPHWSRLAWAGMNGAKRLGLPSASTPTVTVSGSHASIIGWDLLDLIGCYGTQCKDAFEALHYPSSKLVLTGNLSLDHVGQISRSDVRRDSEAFAKAAAQKSRLVLFATSGVNKDEPEIIANIVAMCAQRDAGTMLVIRPHPSVGVQAYEKLIADAPPGCATIITQSTIHEALAACDVAITDFSTVGAEAVLMNRPLLVVNTTGAPFPANNYADLGVAALAKSADQVAPQLQRLLEEGSYWPDAKQHLETFVNAYNWGGDGRASARFLDTLARIATGQHADPMPADEVVYGEPGVRPADDEGLQEANVEARFAHAPQIFRVDPKQFFPRDEDAAALVMRQDVIEYCVESLNIAGKPVLCLGSEHGHAEYWLGRAGCPLTMVDDDRDDTLALRLSRMASNVTSDEPMSTLTYIVGAPGDAPAAGETGFAACFINADRLRRREHASDAPIEPRRATASAVLAGFAEAQRPMTGGWPGEAAVALMASGPIGEPAAEPGSGYEEALAIAQKALGRGAPLIVLAGLPREAGEGGDVGSFIREHEARLGTEGFELSEVLQLDTGVPTALLIARKSDVSSAKAHSALQSQGSASDQSRTLRNLTTRTARQRAAAVTASVRWRDALENAGRPVDALADPFTRTVRRLEMSGELHVACIGARAETIAAMLGTFGATSVLLHEPVGSRPWIAGYRVGGLIRAPVKMADSFAKLSTLGPYDFIAVAGSDTDDLHRAANSGRWRLGGRRGRTSAASKPITFLSPELSAVAANTLSEGGVLAIECTTEGLDFRRSRTAFSRLKKEFAQLGLALLDLHVVRSAPGLAFLVAIKGSEQQARDRALAALKHPPVRTVHSYIELDPRADVVWSAATGALAKPPVSQLSTLRRHVRTIVQPPSEPEDADDQWLGDDALEDLPVAERPKVWRQVMRAAGHPVTALVRPVESAVARVIQQAPRNVLCVGRRAEAHAAIFWQADRPCGLVLEPKGTASIISQLSDAPEATDGVVREMTDLETGTSQGPFDLVIMAGYEREEAFRDTALAAWFHEMFMDVSEGREPKPPPPFFDPAILDLVAATLAPGGLLVIEGAAGGIDVRKAPAAFDRIKSELAGAGLSLVELYLVRQAPGLMLLVAMRASSEAARERAADAQLRKPVERAHRYIEIDDRVDLVWSAVDAKLAPPPPPRFRHLRRVVREVRKIRKARRQATTNSAHATT